MTLGFTVVKAESTCATDPCQASQPFHDGRGCGRADSGIHGPANDAAHACTRKVQARILRPGLEALDLRITSAAPPPLHTAYAALDTVIQDFTREAKLTA